MPISLTDTALDPANAQVKAMLTELQGNILKGHGRDHTFNLFVKFTAGRQALVKDWLSAFSRVFVTSAQKQMEQTNFFKTHQVSAGMHVNLFLTASGYRYLGVPDAKIPANPPFRAGMKASKVKLSDPPASTWDAGYDADIHALILIADDSPQLVRALKRAIIFSLKNLALPMREEAGKGIRNKAGNGIEHNGYADGVSQPLFFRKDIVEEAAKIGDGNWKPAAPLSLALVPDPGKAGAFGSYFVFRKLEQDVQGFKDREDALATKLGFVGEKDRERAGALVVGRFEDGTPVTLEKDALDNIGKDLIPNDFTYASDNGSKCPFHAHIRKTNPRTDGGGIGFNNNKRLVRRGIPYEKAERVRLANGEFDPAYFPKKGDGYGLLFMCFVADIGEQFQTGQFEFMQQSWANNPGFVNQNTGIDPVIGQHDAAPILPQTWPKVWGSAQPTESFSFADFVHMKGGQYFFAPSLPTLLALKVSTNPLLPEPLQIFI